jgi:deoxynucleoside triphosphate triphosphohydrolase SAMHD1
MIEYQNLELPNLEPLNLFNQDQKKRETSSLGMQCLVVRQLLYRGFAFGWQNAIAEPIAEHMEQSGSGTDILMKLVQDSPEYFLFSVRDKYNKIIELLRNQEEAVPLGVPEILVDPPSFSTIQQGHYTLHMEHPTKVAVRWTMPIDKIVEYYQRNRALAYVFGSKEHLPYILLATEKAIWDEWKLVYVQESFVNKRVVSLAADLKIKLDGVDFYRDALELRPVSDFLNSVYAQSLVGCIAQKLAIYESRTKKRVTPSSVTTFVAQFPDDLQPVALEWLQYIDWIEPEDLLQEAISEIKNDPKFKKCKTIALCPLGASSDSAQRIAYYLREKIGDERVVMRSIHEVPGENLDAYILYDDNINTGLQALNIVNSWFGGKLPEDLTLTEDHVSTLTAELIDALKKRPVAFVFGVGVEGACDKLADRLSELLKFDSKLLICVARKELKKASRVFSGPEAEFQHVDKLKLKNFLVSVARELLIAEGKSSEIAQEKTLGYRGAEAMVVFPYNTPTMTITALWIGGEFQGRPWVPLVERGRRTHGIGGELVGEED